MAATASEVKTVIVGDYTRRIAVASVSGTTPVTISPTLAAAKTGTLSTRTSDTAGTLTLAASHGVTTGAELHVYHSGGLTVIPAVGTVSGNSVPFTGATGAVLPALNAAVTAMVPTVVELVFTGTACQAVGVYSPVVGYIVWFNATVAITAATWELTAGESDGWVYGGTGTNPFGSESVKKVKLSHSDSTAARKLECYLLF